MSSPHKNPMHLNSPLKVTVSFTHSCNLNCQHCYASCTREPGPLELRRDEWIAFIDYLIANGIVSLFFEGGEPLNRPDFLEILSHCSRKLLAMIRTNGTLIGTDTARRFKEIGVGTVYVDVMGATAATHDDLTGTAGSHRLACEAVRSLLEAGVPTQMLLILNRRNVTELQDYLDFAHKLGVTAVGILRLYPIGRAKRNWSDLALSLEEMMNALGAMRPPAGLRVMQSWHPNDGNCCWQMAAVNAYGDSIGCSYLREFVNYGNLKTTPFLETWHHPLYRELRSGRVTGTCSTCSETQGSHGGCRSTAYAFSGRWDAPDPFDIALNKGVNLRVLPDWMLQAQPRPPEPTGS